MRVLLSAIACHPDHGSEGGVGWKAATALAREHEVHVLTSSANRTAIESALAGSNHPNLSFTYFGVDAPYHENRLLARAQSWLRYLSWMREVLPQARRVAASRRFDLVHHVTFSTFRVASPLWQLGLPFVFGPTGGGERTPSVTRPSMSAGQRAHESLRDALNALALWNPGVRRTISRACVVLASNRSTAALLGKLGADPSRIIHLPVVFFADRQMRELSSREKKWSAPGTPLRLFSSGTVEGRKGLSIALHAIALARDQGVPCRFTMPSRGPEFAHLRRLATRLGLQDSVHFPDGLSRADFWETLMSSDICLMPSLRDNCPATLLEAMLCRCVPLVVDCNGPGEMVPAETGFKIAPAEPSVMASRFAAELVRLASDRSLLPVLAGKAADHVRANFNEDHYLRTMNEAYRRAVDAT